MTNSTGPPSCHAHVSARHDAAITSPKAHKKRPPPHAAMTTASISRDTHDAQQLPARSRQPPENAQLLLGGLERSLDLFLGLESEDLLGQGVSLGLRPLGDDLAGAQDRRGAHGELVQAEGGSSIGMSSGSAAASPHMPTMMPALLPSSMMRLMRRRSTAG